MINTYSDQLALGIQIEREHKKTYEWLKKYIKKNNNLPPEEMFYEKIARDHLAEDKEYYKKILKAGL